MGREVVLVMKSGREIELPLRNGMLHDPDGEYWPSCSLLLTRFAQGKRRSDEGKDYFGRSSDVYEGHVDLPPRSLSAWKRVGDVSEIFYDRAGDKAPGYFRHRFHKPRGLWRLIFLFKSAAKKPAVLYRLKKSYRLELPEGCIIDDRGIAVP